MNSSVNRKTSATGAIALCLLLASCDWSAPITVSPTRDVVEALIGNWFTLANGDRLQIRKWDSCTYAAVLSDRCSDDLLRAYHSDIGDLQLMSIESPGQNGWTYVAWRLIDHDRLEIRLVNDEIVPAELSGPAEAAALIEANRDNPALFNAPVIYARAQ